jgi:hypothetical protein
MKYSKYFGAKRRGFIKSRSVLAPKGMIHLSENIRYDINRKSMFAVLNLDINPLSLASFI